jgi:probable rRNA maturation factor
MTTELEVQYVTEFTPVPDEGQFRLWVETALQRKRDAMLTVRLVSMQESRALNGRYRGQDKPTNVLSFPAELQAAVDIPLLGDIVICAPLVDQEARAQHKPLPAHWAHLTIHGVLHLLGYDHQQAEAGELMESIEIELLDTLGFRNPYI